jgi:hypothetical protein
MEIDKPPPQRKTIKIKRKTRKGRPTAVTHPAPIAQHQMPQNLANVNIADIHFSWTRLLQQQMNSIPTLPVQDTLRVETSTPYTSMEESSNNIRFTETDLEKYNTSKLVRHPKTRTLF